MWPGNTRSGETVAPAAPSVCHTVLKVPSVSKKYGIPDIGQGTCVRLTLGGRFFKAFPDGSGGKTEVEASMVGMHLADDVGLWDNYGQLQRDFQKLYYDGYIRKHLGEKEFSSYSWDKYEKGDPQFLFEIIPRIVSKEGELGTALGLGTGFLLERWSIPEDLWRKRESAPVLEDGTSGAPLDGGGRPMRPSDQSAVQP